MRTTASVVCLLVILSAPAVGFCQTSTAGSGIDIEIYNRDDGSNSFHGGVGHQFWAYVYIRSGSQSITCELACRTHSNQAQGGTANIATGVVDITFDSSRLRYLDAQNNPNTAAVDGLIQLQYLEQSRIGWALAGDWTPNADAQNGKLANPCDMDKLTGADWAFRIKFEIKKLGHSTLHIRRETDPASFPLSFADVCGSPAFKESNGGIDEVINAEVNEPSN
jgi:hypothetical protein